MFCPRCGQEQVSAEIRFCSRCGLPLNLIAEVVSHNGSLPQLAELYQPKGLFTRKNGLKLGLIWFLLITFLLVPLMAIAGGEEIVAVAAVLGFVGGILIMIFSLLFLKNEVNSPTANQNFGEAANILSGKKTQNALPPQQTIPASGYAPPPAGSWRANTEDLQPRTVTEDTTKLLNKDE